MTESLYIAGCLIVIAFCLGYILGGRHEARYWADHADNGSLNHKGKFFKVSAEGSCIAHRSWTPDPTRPGTPYPPPRKEG